jgi:hypothetical protein
MLLSRNLLQFSFDLRVTNHYDLAARHQYQSHRDWYTTDNCDIREQSHRGRYTTDNCGIRQ